MGEGIEAQGGTRKRILIKKVALLAEGDPWMLNPFSSLWEPKDIVSIAKTWTMSIAKNVNN